MQENVDVPGKVEWGEEVGAMRSRFLKELGDNGDAEVASSRKTLQSWHLSHSPCPTLVSVQYLATSFPQQCSDSDRRWQIRRWQFSDRLERSHSYHESPRTTRGRHVDRAQHMQNVRGFTMLVLKASERSAKGSCAGVVVKVRSRLLERSRFLSSIPDMCYATRRHMLAIVVRVMVKDVRH